MAFQSNNAAASSNNNSNTNQDWKATAFLNLYLPSKTNPSGRQKIGAISFKESKAYDKAMIERLSGDPKALAALLKVLILDFQVVSDKPVEAAALGF